MSEPITAPQPAPPEARRRTRLTVAGGLVLVAAVGALAVFVLHKKAPHPDEPPTEFFDERLRGAIAEVDRRDPRWRFADLEQDRARVPAEENAAPLVMASAKLIPDQMNGLDSVTLRVRLRKGALDANPREEIEPARAVLFEARRLAGFSRGRHAVDWNFKNPLTTPLSHLVVTRNIIDLLTLDAEVLAHEGKVDEALISTHAALVAVRTIGDEPLLAAQVERLKLGYACTQALEESLRRGQGTEGNLLGVQRILEVEAAEPVLRTAARAERAGLHGLMSALEKGEMTSEQLPLLGTDRADGVSLVLGRRRATLEGIHAWLLEYTTTFAEIAERPPEEQTERLKDLAATPPQAPLETLPLVRPFPVSVIGEMYHKELAMLRCAAVAVALERYRLANGRWPDAPGALVPKYIAAVPADPFDGKPLRFAKNKKEVAVFSVGPGGKHSERFYDAPAWPEKDWESEISFRLSNVEGRHKTK
jgi:hypothetical protein